MGGTAPTNTAWEVGSSVDVQQAPPARSEPKAWQRFYLGEQEGGGK